MSFINNILTSIYGPSWRTSLIGDATLFLSYAQTFGLAIPSSWDEAKKITLPALFAIAMRFAKDRNVSGATATPPAK